VNYPLEDREMLILSRKVNESIRIGNDIVVTVVELSRGRVRLGIEAPREVPVHREEIFRELSVSEPCIDPGHLSACSLSPVT
jgi:carbon storage regulator